MNVDQQKNLQWLSEHQFSELHSIRDAEDNLFSWATSIFLAGLGLLTGFKGMNGTWNILWRLLLMFAMICVIGAILLMAFLLRRKYELLHGSLASTISQLNHPPFTQIDTTDQIFFFVRWAAVAAIGMVSLGLIWMLG